MKHRWNSLHMCLSSMMDMRLALTRVKVEYAAENFTQNIPSDEEFDTLQPLIELLNVFRGTSEHLSSDSIPTLHQVVTNIYILSKDQCKPKATDQNFEGLKEFKEELLKGLQHYVPHLYNKLHNIGHFFHPSFKGAMMGKNQAGTKMEEFIKELCADNPQSATEVPESEQIASESMMNDAREMTSIDLFSQEFFGEEESTTVETNALKLEIEDYLSPAVKRPSDYFHDVLAWWKGMQTRLPLLSQLARKYLCLPATSTSSERLFSSSGQVQSDLRYNLAANQLERFVFCKLNYGKLPLAMRKWQFAEEPEEETAEKDDDE